MESLITTFHIDWHLIVAQFVNFAVVFAVLYYFALRPLKKLMEKRGQTIAGGLENAEKQKELLAAQERDYQEALAKARAEAAQIIKTVKADAEAKRAEILEKAQEDAQAVFAAGKEQLAAEKARMLSEARHELVSLVTSATEQVLGGTMNAKIESRLVEETINTI